MHLWKIEEENIAHPGKPGRFIQVRVGIHSGMCHAGVIGLTTMEYDLWGDAVYMVTREFKSLEL